MNRSTGSAYTFGITYDMVKDMEIKNPLAGKRVGVYGKDIDAAWNVFIPALLMSIKGEGSKRMALKLALECVYTAGRIQGREDSKHLLTE